jgi:hypothetical protein
MLVHHHFREQVGNGKLVVGQHLEQPALDTSAHVDRVDHHHVPVARLRLLDDGDAGSGALEFLDVHLDAIGILERLQEVRIGVIAPHQRVEIGGSRRCRCDSQEPRRMAGEVPGETPDHA